MSLLTLEFWPVFILFIIIYYLVSNKFQNLLLFAASAVFIIMWGLPSAVFLIISLLLSYGAYRTITHSAIDKSRQRMLLYSYIAFQISLLFFIKIFMKEFPLGISYYTFTIIAWLLEVFWRRTSLRLSFFEYVTSVSFFPVIMMGPIERLSHFSPQLKNKREFKVQNIEAGLYSLALGLFKITAVSNTLSPLIQHNSSLAGSVSGLGMIIYCILSFFKLYAEFSGFIDVITGISFFMGLKISRNFDQPYLAVNINDVWRRWHISLTSWVRDFVFMPLVLKTRNIVLSSIAVFAAVAAWHGLSLNFLYWGIYWIIFYLIHLALLRRPVDLPHFLKVVITLLITSLSTLSFLVPVSGLQNVLMRLFNFEQQGLITLMRSMNGLKTMPAIILLSIFLMICFETLDKKSGRRYIHARIIALFFLMALLGEFTLQSLLYLRV